MTEKLMNETLVTPHPKTGAEFSQIVGLLIFKFIFSYAIALMNVCLTSVR